MAFFELLFEEVNVFLDGFVIDFGLFFAVGEEKCGFVGFVFEKEDTFARDVGVFAVFFADDDVSEVYAGGD